MNASLSWHIYEITSTTQALHGVMLRGRIRAFTLQQGLTALVENATDKESCVRFAVLDNKDAAAIATYVGGIIPDAQVHQLEGTVINPVLSKLQVNITERYQA
jgi:hypothetical protein